MKPSKPSPSVLFLITFISGLIFSWIHPWHITLHIDDDIGRLTGLVFLFASLTLNTLAYREFKKSLTPHAPFMKPKVLITNGVFTLSRNPVYLALVLSQFGLGFVFDTVWLLISSVLLLTVLDTMIIQDEEKVLQSTFNKDYASYKNKTRRWL